VYRYLLAAALFACMPSAAAIERGDDKGEIRALVDTFIGAIAEKDRRAFLGLFLHDGVTWQPVYSEERYHQARAQDADAVRSAYQPNHSPTQFIQGIVDSAAPIEETFENMLIDTDGAAASVAFDYKFLRNKKVINLGREYWQLVRTDAGWKIASVVWSRHVLPTPQVVPVKAESVN